MRTIKFRAWHSFDKVMIKDAIFGNTERNHTFIDILEYFNDYRVMQFTGLTDKNGVEIFEGDVIITANKTTAKIVFGEFPFRIESEEEGQDIQDKSIGFFFEHPEREYHEPFGECAKGGGSQYEVIGNIYENPELLKL